MEAALDLLKWVVMLNSSISAEAMAAYRASAQKRQQQWQAFLRDRQQLGFNLARQAADLLKQEFQVEKVVMFGSMLYLPHIHERSDLDLAVWGLAPDNYYRAVGRLLALDPRILIDLVEAESAPARILAVIETAGVAL